MRHPIRGAHQRRPLPCHGVRQPHPVGGPAERDVLPRRRWFLLRFGFCGRCVGRCVVDDGADELVSPATDRPDEALRFAVVAERPPGRLDPTGHRRLTDEPPTPDRVEQLFFGDTPLVIADELSQDVEHLWFDADYLIVAAQFVALGVQHEMVEAPHAGGSLSPAVGRLCGLQQSVAQLAQFGGLGALVNRRRHVLCGASHLVNAVGELRGLLGGQHHRIG